MRSINAYVALAAARTGTRRAALIITHGLSGSGKTTATWPLIELAGAVRVRSDIERKRLFGLRPLARSGSGFEAGIYAAAANAATYGRLQDLARCILGAGLPALVDAAFLKRSDRDTFHGLATQMNVPFIILDFTAPPDVLEARLAARAATADDASEADLAVLQRQIVARDPLAPEERSAALTVDTIHPVTRQTWRPVLARLRRAGAASPARGAEPAG